MHLVGDVKYMTISDLALRREVVEQRPRRVAAQDERELPREVISVMQARVEPSPPNGLDR